MTTIGRINRPTGTTYLSSAVPSSAVPSGAYPSAAVLPRAELGAEPSLARGVKRGLDIVVAVVALVLLSPLLVVIAAWIAADRAGSPIFRQVRAGQGGRPFVMVKFRTMRCDAERHREVLAGEHDGAGPLFKLRADPRVTRAGRVLRRYSLDELPQLWNVLRGDMSLVGPRPALPCEVDDYCDRARRRLEAVPGMTGAWQVGGRSTLGWDEGIDLDLHYVDHWSLRYDAVLLVKTVRAVVVPVGAF